ncbi:hypothetical protein ACFV5N_27105 [Streptomyces sp. NPDC059853]|uniref:hypothetical protein n=1 Tax=Streptomyces sp. NPDC059853 TaxID=3346973 RepID=UPI0036491B8C
MDSTALRVIGAATCAYGVAVAVRPGWLARPSGLGEDARVAAALRPVGLRDAVSGAAMVLAPEGPALRTAALLRIAADVGDAVVLGRTLEGVWRRRGAVAVSLAWGALSVGALVAPHRVASRGCGDGARRPAAGRAAG